MKLIEVAPPTRNPTAPTGLTRVPAGFGKTVQAFNRTDQHSITPPLPGSARTVGQIMRRMGIPVEPKMWMVSLVDRGISSMHGGPDKIEDQYNLGFNYLSTFDYAPSFVGGTVSLNGNSFSHLHNIHKHFKHIGQLLHCERMTIRSHVLGIMLIEGLQGVRFSCPQSKMLNQKLLQVQEIINKHLKGARDIHECQQELIDVGLPEYARL